MGIWEHRVDRVAIHIREFTHSLQFTCDPPKSILVLRLQSFGRAQGRERFEQSDVRAPG